MAPSDGTRARPAGSTAGGVLVAAYGVATYLLFQVVFLYLIGFVINADFWVGSVHVVGKSIDRGGVGDGTLTVAAVVIDAALLALFAVQHSVMARATFKRWWTRIVPPSAERSTYVLAATVCLVVLLVVWRPITDDVWKVSAQPWRALLTALGLVGWAIVLLSTFLIDHSDLFGLRQVFARLRGRQLVEHKFATPFFYRAVRHPIYFGFLMAFWATPRMTLGHLLFAAMTTGYILLAVRFEERDLIRAFGEQYHDYRRRVPMLIPGLHGRP
ncbi:MAG TPA: isoprenylcysteine carboxylmethyltransferase family protein [Mycobacterium sp.]|uniref:methanethiol S-methyltransferase n=1 Tax=Mycobacterium sp. TaxID=1785 RepID=UPI002D325468|nr:methanethiol S-methyltransferase [Mycobacterium sp.]HXY64309.1 isoprenylcysteine carboxylmethyltransferase family protein [Mycobacterium sp.]